MSKHWVNSNYRHHINQWKIIYWTPTFLDPPAITWGNQCHTLYDANAHKKITYICIHIYIEVVKGVWSSAAIWGYQTVTAVYNKDSVCKMTTMEHVQMQCHKKAIQQSRFYGKLTLLALIRDYTESLDCVAHWGICCRQLNSKCRNVFSFVSSTPRLFFILGRQIWPKTHNPPCNKAPVHW